jgi:hypothetical protein
MPFDVDERYVRAAEQVLGVDFPTSYRLAMMRSNGGTVVTEDDNWELYPIPDDSDRKRLARTFDGVVPQTERLRTWRGFPETAVAIAANGSGDHLVFLAPDRRQLGPAVFVWLHETGELVPIAKDYAELEMA